MNWNKMVKMTVPVGLCGWQQRGSLTINGRTTEFPVGVETELPEPVAERVKALMADVEEKAEHVQPLKPWMQYVTGADGVARWAPRIDKPGDPHQYLTTDGNGKPHWEKKLAYEASTEEVILPDETVNNIAYGRTWVSCPNASKIQIGNTGTFYINGKAYPYVAIEYSNSSWPSISVQLKLDGKSGLMAVDGNKLMFYDMLVTPPGGSAIISIVNNSTTIKTIDPDKMGKNAGANKALVTDENGEAVWSDSLPGGGDGGVIYVDNQAFGGGNVTAYADATLSTPLTYAQGKAIVASPFVFVASMGDQIAACTPLVAVTLDELAQIQTHVVNGESGSLVTLILNFADTP